MPVICGDHMQTGPTGLTASDKQNILTFKRKDFSITHHSTLNFKCRSTNSQRESHDDLAQLNEKGALKSLQICF